MSSGTAATRSTKAISTRTANILFTCAGRRVALLEAFRSAPAALSLEGKLIATDMTWASPAFQAADCGVQAPETTDPDYVSALLAAVREHEVSLVVPLTDLDLMELAQRSGEFEQLGCTVMIGSEQAISICRDKARTNAKLAEIGLASIKTLSAEEFLAAPFYPCFVKPVCGSAGIGTAVINSEPELHAHVDAHKDVMLVQEYVPGREFTIDVYRTRDGKVRCVVPRQRLLVRSGEVEKGVTVKNDELIEATIRLSEGLDGLWGCFCCQCRWPETGPPRFFEINPRFGGGAPLSVAAGANLPLYAIQEALGLPVTAEVGRFTDRMLMLRYDAAIFAQADDLAELPGHDTPCFR